MASLKVAVRVRPMNKREIDMNCPTIISMQNSHTIITNNSAKLSTSVGSGQAGTDSSKQFSYDYSYWSVNSKDSNYTGQEKVFEDLGQDVVHSAYQGYNACVFAYGQTGSGKTYTMMGSMDNVGLIPRICESLFSQMQESKVTYRTEVSYLEIYNERVRDLLRGAESQMNLRVREHPKEGPYVQDLSRHLVVNYANVENLIHEGNANRTTAATNMNDMSSRSHAIFTIIFTQARLEDGTPSEIHSKIHLVDLAGSERSDMAGTVGDRLKEGASINKSLVTLGNVISALADSAGRMSSPGKQHFIPYRDSVLTWLLKDSLGGNSKTIMIATISPAECNYAETLSTLRYANRAKNIINKPTVNEDPNVKLIRELRQENARLRALLAENMGSSGAQEQLDRNEEMVKQLTEIWADKWHEAAKILREHQMLELRKEGMSVILDSELPYLLALNDNILSTGMKLYHLKEGDTRVGREDAGHPQDIELIGANIEAEHCIIKHSHDGEMDLVPLDGAMCSINNVPVEEPTKLTQGAIIRLGRGQLFRFNHPNEAAKLRQQFGANPTNQLSNMLQDIKWACSAMSVDDSALGSDLDLHLDQKSLCEDCEKLQERKLQLDEREAEHCLAEAKRLSLLAEQEAERDALTQEQLHVKALADQASFMKQQAEQANLEISKLSERIESELRLRLSEVDRLDETKHHLDDDLARLNAESKRLAATAHAQQEEREQLEEAQRHLVAEREAQEKRLKEEQAQLNRSRSLEHDIYHRSMSEMRALVTAEVRDMHKLVANAHVNGELSPLDESTDTANSSFDLDELRLQFEDDDGPVVPDKYLERSDSVPHHESNGDLESCTDPADWSADEIGSRAAQLCQNAHVLHSHVCEVLTRKYTSVLSSDDDTDGLVSKVNTEVTRLRPVFQQLQTLRVSGGSGVCLAAQLSSCSALIGAIHRLLTAHSLLVQGDLLLSQQRFMSMLHALTHAQTLTSAQDKNCGCESSSEDASDETCNSCDDDKTVTGTKACTMGQTTDEFCPLQQQQQQESSGLESCRWWEAGVHGTGCVNCVAGEEEVLKALRTEQCVLRERLHQSLADTWTAAVQHGDRSLTLWRTAQRHALLACTACALHHTRMLDVRLRALADAIVDKFLNPILRYSDAVLRTERESDDVAILHIDFTEIVFNAVPPSEAMKKLCEVLVFLHASLAEITLADGDTTLTQLLGRMMVERNLLVRIHDDCLSPALPRSRHDWEQFSRILALAESFQATLVQLDFVSADQPTLLHHLQATNSLFANAKAEHTLQRAHELMTMTLQPSVNISTEQPLGEQLEQHCTTELHAFVRECRQQTGTSNYKLPNCSVSVCVVQLVLLVYTAVQEASHSAHECASQLHETTCAVFQLFCDVVPPFHADKLAKEPLLAALHHNNCMYIAQHLITINKAFQARFSVLPAGVVGGLGDLGSLISKVKKLGNDAFSEHVALKKTLLCSHLGGIDVLECIADDDSAGATIAITHMLQHLQHISATWREVLPTNVYCRAVGSLLNSVVCNLIASVLTIEEFSAEDCDYLQSVLHLVVDAGPKYFIGVDSSPQVALHEFVTTWCRLCELMSVFGANMLQLSDRWSDGKGPLAMHFTAAEVRRLVVAIFEDTRKRDALLAQLS